ncbi:MAG: hypothetical protein J7474_04580, partial [Arthrobacter sp.]|nr:hypothetical protein [Arthrobacter sp.]
GMSRNDARRLSAAHEALSDRLSQGITLRVGEDYTFELASIALAAADKVDVARWPGHVIEVQAEGFWLLQHPYDCPPRLIPCAVYHRVRELAEQGLMAKVPLGRHSASLTPGEGLLMLVQMPVSPDCRDANHHKCYGTAFDEQHDVVRDCACTCHDEHPVGGEAA